MDLTKIKQQRYSFSWISDCRAVLMGLAALWIVLFHSDKLSFGFLHFKLLSVGSEFIKAHGNAGVDIFLILSGLGLYYSFEKNSSVSEFYKRRFLRVFPEAFVVAIFYYGLKIEGITIKKFLSDIFFLDFYYSGIRTFWYFSLIFVLYALYPLIHRFIKTKPTKRIAIMIIAAVVLNVLMLVFFKSY